jgi:hypothetical protein
MKLSELIEHMQGLIAQHGDHEVWLEDNYGEPEPYRAEWFMFHTEGRGGTPEGVYVI